MKKLIILSFVSLTSLIPLTSLTRLALAAVSTSSAQELRDQLEKRVVEVAKNYQKPMNGRIASLGAKTIALKTPEGDKTIYVSEATLYYRIRLGSRTTIDLKTLKAGDDISALGTLDPATGELSAKQIIAKIKRENIFGKVTEIDKKKGLFTLATNPPIIIDIDPSISFKKVSTDSGIVKAKYTDIVVDTNFSVVGYFDPTDTSSTPPLIALKVLIF